ncbi:MAG TPA: radical SAM protein [Bacillota bacterium]|nr:radical SAM protein [Bacillota bacterium]
MGMTQNYIRLMDHSINRLFRDALAISRRDPGLMFFLLQTIFRQRKAAVFRRKWSERGLRVPPLMILSITHQCNLRCKGCYAQALHRPEGKEISINRLLEIIGEAGRLGIRISLLAGGEPLTRPEVLEIAAGFPKIIFPVFTNGLLIDEEWIQRFKKHKNIIPVISLEGAATETDARRGEGVYQKLRGVLQLLNANRIFYGVSMTVTRMNLNTLIEELFIKELLQEGCRLFFYVEYVPVKEDTAEWVLTEEQRSKMLQVTQMLRSHYPALFIAFPSDEEQFGGCLAAGRGFIHISPDGNLEPCPFSPYSDTNLNQITLQDALQSKFLEQIRGNHEQLQETAGGCALWENREWVSSLLSDKQDQKQQE